MCFRPPSAVKNKLCPKCGVSNLGMAPVCKDCGEPLPGPPAPGAARAPGAPSVPSPGAPAPPSPPKAPPKALPMTPKEPNK